MNTGYLLGDSAYPSKSYLLTPVLNPRTPEEQRYNRSHIRTRNTIERCFGVLKSFEFSLLEEIFASCPSSIKTICGETSSSSGVECGWFSTSSAISFEKDSSSISSATSSAEHKYNINSLKMVDKVAGPVCVNHVDLNNAHIICSKCDIAYHKKCSKLKDSIFKTIIAMPDIDWFCDQCNPKSVNKEVPHGSCECSSYGKVIGELKQLIVELKKEIELMKNGPTVEISAFRRRWFRI
ncbi:hypothetical protein J437_LFUL019404 [Ladona fulva]|uniref:DDE Tnp4 domain-containing protein n=1 Tax=Ladona fulva TaxID=123851 RepID=A0A8K0KQS0_LADFU|nr:hypothetical protein J437_LFUL019404 [Ladona fulva]